MAGPAGLLSGPAARPPPEAARRGAARPPAPAVVARGEPPAELAVGALQRRPAPPAPPRPPIPARRRWGSPAGCRTLRAGLRTSASPAGRRAPPRRRRLLPLGLPALEHGRRAAQVPRRQHAGHRDQRGRPRPTTPVKRPAWAWPGRRAVPWHAGGQGTDRRNRRSPSPATGPPASTRRCCAPETETPAPSGLPASTKRLPRPPPLLPARPGFPPAAASREVSAPRARLRSRPGLPPEDAGLRPASPRPPLQDRWSSGDILFLDSGGYNVSISFVVKPHKPRFVVFSMGFVFYKSSKMCRIQEWID